MKITKRVITIILSIALVVGGLYFVAPNKTKAATDFAITSPKADSLKAAGPIDITWEDASEIKEVASYDLFIDGKLEKNTTDREYEFYTTKVNFHKVWVRANFRDGTNHYTETVRFGVTKKGIATEQGMGAYVLKTRVMGIGWYYNWGRGAYNTNKYKDLEYVPMVWGDTNADTIKSKMQSAIDDGYKHMLGFNEPDMDWQGGGCNMDNDTVVSLWPNFTQYMGQIRVGSPAYAIWGEKSRMVDFMARVDNNTDFVCLHCYPADWNGGQAMAEWFLESVVDDAYNRYHKPIWITEYSTSGNGITQAGTSSFIRYLFPGLDEREYVERHSFFSFNSASFGGGLYNYSTGELSESGIAFSECGNPETDYVAGPEKNPRDVDPTTEATSQAPTSQAPTTTAAFGPNTDVPLEDWIQIGNYGVYTGSWAGTNTAKAGEDPYDPSHIVVQKTDGLYGNEWLTQVMIQFPDLNKDEEYTYEWPIKAANDLGNIYSSDGDQGSLNATVLNGEKQTLTGRTEVKDGIVSIVAGMGQVNNTNPVEFFYPTVKDKDGNVVYPKETPTTRPLPTTTEPTTQAPTTTVVPTTTTIAPTTTIVPTTTTIAPTTKAPTTKAPTTQPTTVVPTTKAPTTASPTTESPETETVTETTVAPTAEPTTVPSTTTVKPSAKPTIKIKPLGRAKIKKAKYKKKRKISLKLKKVKGAKGYQIKYSDSKKFDGYWIKNTKKLKVTLKKLDKYTKYYIKVRAYKLVNGAKFYGKWSKKKKVKVKK